MLASGANRSTGTEAETVQGAHSNQQNVCVCVPLHASSVQLECHQNRAERLKYFHDRSQVGKKKESRSVDDDRLLYIHTRVHTQRRRPYGAVQTEDRIAIATHCLCKYLHGPTFLVYSYLVHYINIINVNKSCTNIQDPILVMLMIGVFNLKFKMKRRVGWSVL